MFHPRGEFIWFFFVPMALCLGFGTFFLVKNIRILNRYEKTIGTVKDYTAFSEEFKAMNRLSDNLESFGMNAIYQAKNGEYYGVSSVTRTSWKSLQAGDQVTVYYLASDPKQAHLGTFINFWLHIVALLFIGFILFIVWWGSWMYPAHELQAQGQQTTQSRPRM